jgi:hypothetical protein
MKAEDAGEMKKMIGCGFETRSVNPRARSSEN